MKIYLKSLLLSLVMLFSNSYAKDFDYYDYKINDQNHDQIISYCTLYLIFEEEINKDNPKIKKDIEIFNEYMRAYSNKYYHLLSLDNSKKIIDDFEKRTEYFIKNDDQDNLESSLRETAKACLIVIDTFK